MASTTTTNGSLSNGPVTGPVGPTQQMLMSDAAWFSWALLLSIALMLSTLLMLSSVDAEHFSDAEQCEHWCLMLHGTHIRYLWFQLIQPHRTPALLLMKYLRGVWWTYDYIVFRIFVTSWWPNRVKGYFQFSGRLILCRLPLVHNCTELPCLFLVFFSPASFLCILYLMLFLPFPHEWKTEVTGWKCFWSESLITTSKV